MGASRLHLVSKPASHSSHSSHHCQKRKSKRVDEVCRLRVGLSAGFKWVLRTYTLSQYLISTLCRIHFVSTLCPYALSKAEDQANVPPSRSLPMRLGARGLRGFCGAHEAENVTAGDTTSPRLRSTGGGLQRYGLSVHIRWRLYRSTPPAAPAQVHGTANER